MPKMHSTCLEHTIVGFFWELLPKTFQTLIKRNGYLTEKFPVKLSKLCCQCAESSFGGNFFEKESVLRL